MKIRILVPAVSLILAFLFATPDLRSDIYVGGSFGFGFPRDHGDDDGNTIKLDDDLGGSVAVGFNFDPVRLEGEFVYRTSDVRRLDTDTGPQRASGSVQNLGLMLNGFYDFYGARLYRPYIGGGFGASRISAERIRSEGETVFDDSETVFAYQAMAGVEYELARNAAIRAGYRFFATQNASWGEGRVDGSRIHIIEVGIRGSF